MRSSDLKIEIDNSSLKGCSSYYGYRIHDATKQSILNRGRAAFCVWSFWVLFKGLVDQPFLYQGRMGTIWRSRFLNIASSV